MTMDRTNKYYFELQNQFANAEDYYYEQKRLYDKILKTGDAIAIRNHLNMLQLAETSMSGLKKMVDDVFFELEAIRLAELRTNQDRKIIYSSLTGEDLTDMENEIKHSLDDYNAKLERYNDSVALGSVHAVWAKNNLLPSVNIARDYCENLKTAYDEMLKSIQEVQSIKLTNLVADEVKGNVPENNIPWKTIGLAAGALVVVVVVSKVL